MAFIGNLPAPEQYRWRGLPFGLRTAGAEWRAGAKGTHHHATVRHRRFVRRSDGEEPCRDHPLDQGKSDRCAGRSPGLRVIARCTPSRVNRPS